MKLKCKLENILEGLNVVQNTASSKTTMPILEGVLIEVIDNNLKLITYNLETGTTYNLECDSIENGSIVVNIKMLLEILRKLNSDVITLEVIDNIFIINSKNGIYKLSTMDYTEFPNIPVFEIKDKLEISSSVFKNMIKKVIFAISSDTTREVTTGAYIKIEDNILTVVAIDINIIAYASFNSDKKINNFSAIIPCNVLYELLKIIGESDDLLNIGINENKAVFEINNIKLTSRLINGNFVDYKRMIPEELPVSVKVNTKELLDSFERVSLFSREGNENEKKSPVKVIVNIDGINLSCSGKTGVGNEFIEASVNGEEIIFGINPKTIIDTLKVIEDEEITIELKSNIFPIKIASKSNSYIYTILPIKLKMSN
ncbi:MAG: DNA polymerase III subunit beta [Clostridia bacterium]